MPDQLIYMLQCSTSIYNLWWFCLFSVIWVATDWNLLDINSLQLTFVFLVLPCLILGYLGQAAYLIQNPAAAEQAFFSSIPSKTDCFSPWILWGMCHVCNVGFSFNLEVIHSSHFTCMLVRRKYMTENVFAGGAFWPIFFVANIAALIASRAMTTATFSCIKQSTALGCFPRLKIIHTSRKFMGQIYIPVMNWFLLVLCLVLVCTISSITEIGNAYGNSITTFFQINTHDSFCQICFWDM